MQVLPIKIRPLIPPHDSLREALSASKLKVKNGDIVAISSKVVSIDEGKCIPCDSISKERLVQQETDLYYKAPNSKYRHVFTIAGGALVGSAGVDESNGNGFYILYPENPMASAHKLRLWLQREYGVSNLGVVITDSISTPLRRGAVGFALAWDGFEPLKSYTGTKDIFGREFQFEVANIADSLATAAVLEMGEGKEQTPVVIIRDVMNVVFTSKKQKQSTVAMLPDDDMFAPLLFSRKWKKGNR